MAADRNPLAVHLGKRLRVCRARAKISQEALGEIASLHRTEISLLERGEREPRLGTIIKLADALSVPLSEFFAGIEWKSGDPGSSEFVFEDSDDVPVE
jgi:transcriptional regulator with XRE-family HTH domain